MKVRSYKNNRKPKKIQEEIKKNSDSFDAFFYPTRDYELLHENIWKSKYVIDFSGLSQETVFKITNNVVTTAAEQLVNLHNGIPYKEALEKLSLIRETLLFSGLETHQKQVMILITERSQQILEYRMKNTLVEAGVNR